MSRSNAPAANIESEETIISSPSLPREKIPWFPTINYDLCKGAKECLAFCPSNVFAWDELERAPSSATRTVAPWVAPIVCGYARMVPLPSRTWTTSRLR